MPEDADVRWVLGRRDRKRLETRKGLAAVAFELFAERGFDAVTVNDILANLTQNAENAARLVTAAVRHMPEERQCKCGSALAHALITDRKSIPPATRKKLELLVGKYL